MIFDNLYNFTEQFNGEGLYWNYWYHVWKTFSISPFANNALFIPGTPAVNSVTVSPSAVTASEGQSVSFSAVVSTDYFAPQTVNWSSSSDAVTINASGTAVIGEGLSAGDEITITATSVYDDTVTGTATITIA